MKQGIFLLFFSCCTFVQFAQDNLSLRHAQTETFRADFYVSLEEKKIKFADTLFYTWFKSQKIHTTKGYATGNLLSGDYKSFYHSGQLMEHGTFSDGLKNGEWKSWYESGQLQSLVSYDHGLPHGNFFRYAENGSLVESGTYKSGFYHGEVTVNGETHEFKNGKRQEEKVKPEKESEQVSEDLGEKKMLFKNKKDRVEGERKFNLKSLFKRKEKSDKSKPEREPKKEDPQPKNDDTVSKKDKKNQTENR